MSMVHWPLNLYYKSRIDTHYMTPDSPSQHPIDQDLVESVPIEDTGTSTRIHDSLAAVQTVLEDELSGLHRAAANGKDHIAAWGQTRSKSSLTYLFLGDFGPLWTRVFTSAAVDNETLRKAVRLLHKRESERHAQEVTYDAVVIAQPPAWTKGQEAARIELESLLDLGLSSAEALDLWFLKYGPRTETQTRQAERRSVSPQAVHNNVQSARSKLEGCQTTHFSSRQPRNP